MNRPRTLTVWLGALALALLALAGCGAGTEPSAGASTPPATASPSARPTTATPTVTATATATPAPTPTPVPTKAADGTDPDACRDGKCEVKVKGGWSAEISRYRVDQLTVESLSPNEITLTFSLPEGEFELSCDGDPECMSSITGTYAIATAHLGARVNINRISVEVAGLSGNSAILRIKRR